MLHVVLWVSARNSCLFLAGQYPSEFYVACCVVGICKTQLFVSSRPIPIRIAFCMLCCGLLQVAVCFQPANTYLNSMLHVVLWVFASISCLFLAGQYPSEFYVACCVVGICKKQLFVSSRSIPIRILCCMLCWGQLQEIAVCFQPVNTHPNSMLHVVLWVFANSCLFLAGQYPSEFYVACCVVGICKKLLFVSSRPIPIRILCCMLCCGYLQEIAVCFQPVNTHPNSMLHVVLWVFENSCLFVTGQYPSKLYVACCVVGICTKQLFVLGRSIPIQRLCCMPRSRYLQEIDVCFQPVNTHLNFMFDVVLCVFARNCCLFLACQCPSKFYVACCVVSICKKQLFVSSRSIPIRILCCMLCWGQLQDIAVCFQPVNTHLNSMLHVVLQVFARNCCLFLAGQYPSEFYVACCVGGICKQLFVSGRSIPIRILCCMLCCGYLQEIAVCFQPVNTHLNSILHVVLWVFANSCLFLAGQHPSEVYVACCFEGICKQLFVSSRSIPIRILCCMLCSGHLQIIAVCFKLVNPHLNSMLHVVLWVSARHSYLFLAGQYLSEFYVACCVGGGCKKWLFVSSRSIPIRLLCCMLCCEYLQIAVCFQPVNTHPNLRMHVVLWVFARNSCLSLAGQNSSECHVACCAMGICEKQLFVSSRSKPIRLLCCMLCCKELFVSSRSIPVRMLCCMLRCGYLQEIAVCLQPVNTHPNSMLQVALWVFARNSCLSLAGQYPSELLVACCVVGICEKQLFVSRRSMPIRILCCMLCCGYLQIGVCF